MRATPQAMRQEREQLEAERRQVLQDIQILRESLKGEVDIDLEEGDPDLIEREKSAALLATLERKLESIETALRSIEKGLYGICERCGQPIDPERLEVKPDATLCLPCQIEVEKLIKRGLYRPTLES
ncbi:MAG: TraR/DksA C4-type zinc finger protein [Anaerolineae bacterium]|nr:TraR/DksA C4-type zinc finger protein [Anaerolineae bacterium]MDW8098170.1 TraR/DksA C4-type zinc finger protein [Anaerolineae bacterium]